MEAYQEFGSFFRKKRMEMGLTLRQFCLNHSLDPGNISRIERGLSSPPQSRELLTKYAGYLGLKNSTDDWYQFFDFAHAAAGTIPNEIMEDKELAKMLPLVFRTIRGQKVPDDKLDDLIKLIKES